MNSIPRLATRPSERKRQRQTRLAGSLLILLLIVAVAVLYAVFYVRQEVMLNDADLCPQKGPHGYYSILIDTTQPYNPIQEKFLLRELDSLKHKLKVHHLVSVFAVDDTYRDTLDPIVSICNPGTGAGLSSLWHNPEHYAKRWQTQFSEPLKNLFRQLLRKPASKYSPIMEMIQAVSLSTFGTKEDHQEAHLLIISDLLQNTPAQSHYKKGSLDFEKFRISRYFKRNRTDLRGVTVSILYARRAAKGGAIQGARHRVFWETYLRAMGAKRISIRPIEG